MEPLLEDHHVHSVFSDGKGTIAENIAVAESKELRALTCVDHVRLDSDWLSLYAEEVSKQQALTSIRLRAGIEAKILNQQGQLDLPLDYKLADVILIADHQFPGSDGPVHPRAVKERLQVREVSAQEVISQLLTATTNAISGAELPVIVAHLASLLPKMGLSEEEIEPELLVQLGEAVVAVNGAIEISERWKCPSPSTLKVLATTGAKIICGSDAHRPQAVGQWDYCAKSLQALDDNHELN